MVKSLRKVDLTSSSLSNNEKHSSKVEGVDVYCSHAKNNSKDILKTSKDMQRARRMGIKEDTMAGGQKRVI